MRGLLEEEKWTRLEIEGTVDWSLAESIPLVELRLAIHLRQFGGEMSFQ